MKASLLCRLWPCSSIHQKWGNLRGSEFFSAPAFLHHLTLCDRQSQSRVLCTLDDSLASSPADCVPLSRDLHDQPGPEVITEGGWCWIQGKWSPPLQLPCGLILKITFKVFSLIFQITVNALQLALINIKAIPCQAPQESKAL